MSRMAYPQEIEVATHLARSVGVPFIDLREYSISAGILRKLPDRVSRRYRCVPIVFNHRRVVLVHDNPADGLLLKTDPSLLGLPVHTGHPRTVEFALTTSSALEEALRRRSSLPDGPPDGPRPEE